MAAVLGAAPAAAAAAQSTETEWTAFLDQLRDEAEIGDFIENLGQDLVGSEILREAEFGKKPSMLQKSKLKAKLRGSKIFVGDIEADASWKNKQEQWWDEHGSKLVIRIQDAWKRRAGGVGSVTDEMIRGQVLSRQECNEVVEDEKMAAAEQKLEDADFEGCKKLIASNTRFGSLFQRGWVNFKADGSKTEPSDQGRRRLNAAFLAYSRLWTGKALPALFKKKYARRSYYKPKFFEQLHEQLAAFAAGKDLEDGFLGAMALMADVKSVKELGSCGMSTVAKAAETALMIYDLMLDDVGDAAAQRAHDILDVWADADPHWEAYGKYYECPANGAPLACVQRFIVPVVRDWLSEYWTELLKQGGAGRAASSELERMLDLDEMKKTPKLGMRLFEERAADVKLTLGGSPKRSLPADTGSDAAGGRAGGQQTLASPDAGTGAGQQDHSKLKRPDLLCDHCGKRGHQKTACWVLHPELNPRTPEGKLQRAKDKERSRAERARRHGYGAYGGYGGYGGQPQAPPMGFQAGWPSASSAFP
jgi:hypothetical protein